MRLSLSGRIALVLAVETAIFGAAVGWLVWSADSLFDSLSVVKDEVEPAVDDLRTLLVELKAAEDAIAAGRRADVERARGQLPVARVFERMASAATALRRVSERDDVPAEPSAELAEAARVLDEAALGDRLVSGAMKTGALPDGAPLPESNAALLLVILGRLDAALGAGREAEAKLLAHELLRLLRHLRGTAVRGTNIAATALREMNHALFERRSEVSISLVLVPAGALVAVLLLLLLLLRALRPVRELSAAVRRLARGDYATAPSARWSREFADLAEALNSLAAALRTREEESQKSRDEAMKTERLAVVGRMASVVAHEVRNPLNSIALNVDLLREMLSGHAGERELEVLTAVQREVDRLSDITEEYLRFGRLPKGVLAPCDAARVVRETRTFVEGELTEAGIAVEVRTPAGPVQVLADEAQLRQALLNILRNAVEATPAGGRVTLDLSVREGRAHLAVTDTGCGIPDSFRERLFEPFATTKPRGTGLGLAFVQQVMHECGGSVAIDSAPGKGTTVRLTLRLAIEGKVEGEQ